MNEIAQNVDVYQTHHSRKDEKIEKISCQTNFLP